MDQTFLQKLTGVIDANLSDPAFGAEKLSAEMGMSHTSLLRKVRSYTGKSITKLIREFRLKKALEILRSEDITVSEVAFKLGFSSPSYFTTCFKEFFGYPPGEARNLNPDAEMNPPTPAGFESIGPERKSRKSGMAVLSVLILVLIVTGALFIPTLLESSERSGLSVAVLPFTLLSDEPDKQIYADGMMEGIIQNLARIRELRVIPATSMDQYGNKGKSIKTIGEEINVTHILAGSFQKLGDTVRLRVRLVAVEGERQIWDFDYYEDWAKVFSIQSEVARSIAKEIQVNITSSEKKVIENPITTDTTAYDYYLHAMDYRNSDFWDHHNKYAILLYDKAVKIDPDFALAWRGLSSCYRELYWNGWDRRPESLMKAKEYLDKALQIAPDLKEIRMEEAAFYYQCNRDYSKSLQLLEKLKSEFPYDSEIHFWIGAVYRRMGEYGKALKKLDQAISLNPADWSYWSAKAQTARAHRDFVTAESSMNKALELNPSIWGGYEWLFLMYGKTGQIQRATSYLETHQDLFPSEINKQFHSWLESLAGNYEKAIQWLQSGSSDPISGTTVYFTKNLELGLAYRLIPDTAKARYHFTKEMDFLLGKINGAENDERLYCSLGICYAGLGMKAQALAAGQEALKILNIDKDPYSGYITEMRVVWILVMVGEYDRALEKLDLIMGKNGDDTAEILKLDPFWNPVRNYPKFIGIINNPAYQAKLSGH